MAERACADCGASLNAGEALTFTVCDACWDKAHPKAPAPNRYWLEAARERCERAAPKPWAMGERDRDGTEILTKGVNQGYPDDVGTVAEVMWGADAEFIAAARTDLPRALDEIERLRDERDDILIREFESADEQAAQRAALVKERDTLRARVGELEERVHKADGMANEVNILTREVRAAAYALTAADALAEAAARQQATSTAKDALRVNDNVTSALAAYEKARGR